MKPVSDQILFFILRRNWLKRREYIVLRRSMVAYKMASANGVAFGIPKVLQRNNFGVCIWALFQVSVDKTQLFLLGIVCIPIAAGIGIFKSLKLLITSAASFLGGG
jgi:hypothetical protein